MLTTEDRSCLARIQARYQTALAAAAEKHNHRAEVLAGIMMRETRGGESKWLVDESHTPDNKADDVGDAGHGHGLMQIDDRSFPDFCRSEDWKDPILNILFGARVLDGKRRYIAQGIIKGRLAEMTPAELERAAIAAYNCGEGNALKSWIQGEDPDTHTTGRDYSRCVLEFAEAYAQICRESQPAPAPEPPAPRGILAAIQRLLLRFLAGEKAR